MISRCYEVHGVDYNAQSPNTLQPFCVTVFATSFEDAWMKAQDECISKDHWDIEFKSIFELGRA